ncbi:helix-turn-helix transcriptional regulator [Burkholderia guangdongensis]|uniref:helix-turn-helix transcriptional regulator n=1 Tax=Burkholderia guangdongensis TaxID=1792500 RepID=UPI0015CC9EE0|nr:helix-turn-helix transcriptional regulator [Burkholderia guangdongensis]
MSVAMSSFNGEAPQFNMPFKPLGEVVDAVGTPRFIDRLTVFLNKLVPHDVTHLERTRVDRGTPDGCRHEWLGSFGMDGEPQQLAEVMDLYYARYRATDPLFTSVHGELGTRLLLRDMSLLPSGEFRRRIFDERQVTNECVIVKGAPHVQYGVALVRKKWSPPFSLTEMSQLKRLGEFLFPLVVLHASTTAARKIAHLPVEANPLALFDARLESDGIGLSKREYELCRHLIGGRSVAETAGMLGVQLTSAQTYVKRAFVKLGVRTKRELIAWGYAGEDARASC